MKKQLVFLLSTLIGCVNVVKSQSPKKPHSEQRQFSLIRPVSRPAQIPDAVLRILTTDENVTTSGCEITRITNAWFEASNITINAGDREPALLVKAKDGCLFGANIGPFWIFKRDTRGYSLILAVSGLSLDVLSSKSNDYKNIRVGAVSSGHPVYVIYKFKGSRYEEVD